MSRVNVSLRFMCKLIGHTDQVFFFVPSEVFKDLKKVSSIEIGCAHSWKLFK